MLLEMEHAMGQVEATEQDGASSWKVNLAEDVLEGKKLSYFTSEE